MHHDLLCDAIRRRHLVQFRYEVRPRLVEPFALGQAGYLGSMLYGWERLGPRAPGWNVYRVANIGNLAIEETRFDFESRHGYTGPPLGIGSVICEILLSDCVA
jgi:hypothetical protein